MLCASIAKLCKRGQLPNIARHISKTRFQQDIPKKQQTHEEIVQNIFQAVANDPKVFRDVLKSLKNSQNSDEIMAIIRPFARDFDKKHTNKDEIVTFDEFKEWLNSRQPLVGLGSKFESDLNSGVAARPTNEQLFLVALNAGAPFVGFGFLDNAIMILAGNEIEIYFGVSFGLSALAAAALGNTISDMAGIQAGGIIESASTKLGIRDPNLTLEQMKLNICKYITVLAQLFGITLGCLLGMFPLLFIEDESQQVIGTIRKHGLDNQGRMEVRKLKDLLGEVLKDTATVDVDEFFGSLRLQDNDLIDEKECVHLYKSFLSLKSFQETRTAAALPPSLSLTPP